MSSFKNIKEQLFFGSLVLVLITLSLPKYSLNSQSIIVCALCWFFYNSFQQKYKYLKKNFIYFLLFSSLFWIALFGMLYSQNIAEGIKNLQKQLPFLIFPLIFFSIDITPQIKQVLIKYFSYGVIVSAMFAITKAGYFKINNFGDYFYYDKFGLLLDIHTTYYAMYVIIAIAYFTEIVLKSSWSRKRIETTLILFLLIVLYILSVRMAVIALAVSTIILFLSKRALLKPKNIVFLFFSILIILFSYFSPNFQKRFNAETPEGIAISDIDTRTNQWQSVLQVIENNNLVIGAGTGDGHETLYDQYLKNGFETGYIYQYNAHNQFLETTLYYGLLGLFLLVTIMFIAIKECYLNRNYLGISIITIQIIFMITESTLESQSGIVLFAFFTTMLASRYLSDKARIN